MAITASLVKELRDKTNAGMMDCKSALAEAEGDLVLAEEILRKKGIASAGKKASREAKEGVIAANISDCAKVGILAEINCETDFVAKNENFGSFVDEVTSHLTGASAEDAEAALAEKVASGDTLEDFIKGKISELKENMVLRRFTRYTMADGANGAVASYIHLAGKVGVLVEVGAEKAETASADAFKELAKDITLHIAAANPQQLDSSSVPADIVAKEREIFAEQMKDKPANVIERIVDGKIAKFFSEICLLDQGFVKDPDTTITALLEAKGKELGDTLTIRRFTRFGIGEAI